MRTGSIRLGLFVALMIYASIAQAATVPLPRSSPEAQGISSKAVLEFIQAEDKINTLHSFMVLRHGHVIAEAWWKPEAADKPHVLWSLSKSFNSTAVGLAIEEGKLNLDDSVLKFFPDDAPATALSAKRQMERQATDPRKMGRSSDGKTGPQR